MAIERNDAEERLERIERMIDEYRTARQRRITRSAVKLRTEVRKALLDFDPPPERMH